MSKQYGLFTLKNAKFLPDSGLFLMPDGELLTELDREKQLTEFKRIQSKITLTYEDLS